MKVYPNIFSNNPLDRVSYLRSDPEWIKKMITDSKSMFVPFSKGQPFVSTISGLTSKSAVENQLSPAWFPYNFFDNQIIENSIIIFLGLLDDIAFFAIDLSKINDPENQVNLINMGSFEDLMALSSQPIESGELAMLGQAKAIFEWHNSHTYCSRCGEKSNIVEGGYKRVCNYCKAEHFPRTDPVVIMLATYNDHAFLGRQKRFPPGMYSALAGFIEPGESIEEAVARELNEEAGIIINDATYHSSQPWAFPNSLMIGCIAESTSEKFKLDEIEIDEGRWFQRTELKDAINGNVNSKFFVPPKMAIAHHLIKAFVENK
jgi:NAD+ diphosphatase